VNKNSRKVDILLLTETNFILDITFEQSQQCEQLLFLAREHEIQVVIPEYSFAEAEGNIGNTIQKRLSAIDSAILQFARENQAPDLKMLFLTRDKTDFDFPYIRMELASLSVELFFSAGECIRRIRELLGIS